MVSLVRSVANSLTQIMSSFYPINEPRLPLNEGPLLERGALTQTENSVYRIFANFLYTSVAMPAWNLRINFFYPRVASVAQNRIIDNPVIQNSSRIHFGIDNPVKQNSSRIHFGPEEWYKHLGCVTRGDFECKDAQRSRYRIFIPESFNGKDNTLGNLIDLLSGLPNPIKVVVHIPKGERLVRNDGSTLKKCDLLLTKSQGPYWGEISMNRGLKAVHQENPKAIELVTLFAARILSNKKVFNAPRILANEKLLNERRVFVCVRKNVIYIDDKDYSSSFERCVIHRYYPDGWIVLSKTAIKK